MLLCLFIAALWSPAGKGLTSWLSFVVFNCVFVTFPCSILGQVWYLIVLIADLCHLSYFYHCFRDNDQKQYIQVDLGASYQIAGVVTQGRSDAPEWVTKYEVYYSRDGKHYTAVPTSTTDSSPRVFNGNTDQNTPVKNMFPLIYAKWIR